MDTEKDKQLFEQLDLVGVSDIAKMTGWKMTKVTSYRTRGILDLPDPIGYVGGRPVWTRRSVISAVQEAKAKERK